MFKAMLEERTKTNFSFWLESGTGSGTTEFFPDKRVVPQSGLGWVNPRLPHFFFFTALTGIFEPRAV